KVAKERGLAVVESPFFLRDEPIGDLGAAPEIAARAFTMKDGEVTAAMRVSRGWVFATPAGTQDSYVPQLADVTDRVREDAARDKAAEMLKARASVIAADLLSAKDFAAAAKKAGFEVKPTELIARGAALPDIGANPSVDEAVFALPVGGVTGAITTPTGSVIARVAERVDVTDAQIAGGSDALREELVDQRRGQFFSAYMAKAKTALSIDIRQDLLTQLLGPMPAAAPGFPAPASAPMPVPGQ
ncbi:MAG TPA: peptidyl-prolyl cis-trans isomerase, partial [Vicinamibacterales bacterium]|nr:peptidyl-prolyl cis-trans isomerase [Vicinamibacterales bacterium]